MKILINFPHKEKKSVKNPSEWLIFGPSTRKSRNLGTVAANKIEGKKACKHVTLYNINHYIHSVMYTGIFLTLSNSPLILITPSHLPKASNLKIKSKYLIFD